MGNRRQALFALLLAIGSLTCFAGYCTALIDWVQDYKTGVYERNHLEAFLETGALGFYTFLGIRFMRLRMRLL
ncbi:hypothetical protein [Spirosoma jeollabukense]